MSSAGKVAIVTGAARGIGRSYATALAQAGASVLVVDLREEEGGVTAAALRESGCQAEFCRVDVSSLQDTEMMAKTAFETFGGIDILVNNAGMFASLRGGPMGDISVERWDATMAVNVRGPWLCCRAVVPYMRQRGGGAIINQTSISAYGMPGLLDYTSSKAALIGMTKSLASELGRDNIRVNAIAPGGTVSEGFVEVLGGDLKSAEERANTTQLIKGQIKPDDLNAALLLLADDRNKYMTGQTIVIDGGKYFLG